MDFQTIKNYIVKVIMMTFSDSWCDNFHESSQSLPSSLLHIISAPSSALPFTRLKIFKRAFRLVISPEKNIIFILEWKYGNDSYLLKRDKNHWSFVDFSKLGFLISNLYCQWKHGLGFVWIFNPKFHRLSPWNWV